MLRLINLEKNEFDNFVKNNKYKSHFLQSLSWGEFAKAKKNVTPFYLGLIDDKKNILGATLLLEKKLPLNYSYFYAPRGFVLDYSKKNILKEMTKKVVEFCKKKKAIFLKIDPDLIKEKESCTGEKTTYDNTLYNNLIEVGFKHQGFTKNFETNQPRYTFRIDLTKGLEEVENCFSKTTKQRIAKAEKLNIEAYIGNKSNIKDFYYLMQLTENRKDFISYNESYYETLYEVLNGNPSTKATLFIGKIVFSKTIKELEKKKKENVAAIIFFFSLEIPRFYIDKSENL